MYRHQMPKCRGRHVRWPGAPPGGVRWDAGWASRWRGHGLAKLHAADGLKRRAARWVLSERLVATESGSEACNEACADVDPPGNSGRTVVSVADATSPPMTPVRALVRCQSPLASRSLAALMALACHSTCSSILMALFAAMESGSNWPFSSKVPFRHA